MLNRLKSSRAISHLPIIGLLIGAATFVPTTPAYADLIRLNLSALPIGTDASHLADGLTLQHHTNTPGDLRIDVVSDPAIGSTLYGTGIFTGSLTEYYDCQRGSLDCREGYAVLELLFDTPTDFVEIVSNYESDFPGLVAFDQAGNNLTGGSWCSFYPHTIDGCVTSNARVDLPGYGTVNQKTQSMTTEGRVISRVLIAGLLGRSTVREITYGVPEPATLGFTILGLAAARLSVRRRPRGGRHLIRG